MYDSAKIQYNETTVMHFLFGLLRITELYMYRALFAHPQKVLHNRHLVYCVHVMPVSCIRFGLEPEMFLLSSLRMAYWCTNV
jgi:hypothetical protein